MRSQEWIEGNIQKTHELSKGQVAYVFLPNTAANGFNSFNRYFFAQTDKTSVTTREAISWTG